MMIRRLIQWGCVAGMLMLPRSADATTIYSNFGAGLAYDTATANPVGFDFFTGDVATQAGSFTSGVDSVLTSITIALSDFSGTNSSPLAVTFRSDIGGLPDGVLETFLIPALTLGPFGSTNAPLVLTSAANPLLVLGQRYWVAVAAAASDPVAWNLNSIGAVGGTATSVDGGATWNNLGLTPGAYEVAGTVSTVPEPGSLLLIGTGIVAASIRRRFGAITRITTGGTRG